jgi:hypothetical protein
LVGDFKKINIWDLGTNQCVGDISILESTLSLGWIRGGSRLLALLSNGTIILHSFDYPSRTLKRLRMIPAHKLDNGEQWTRGVMATHTNSGKFATCCSEEIVIWKVNS